MFSNVRQKNYSYKKRRYYGRYLFILSILLTFLIGYVLSQRITFSLDQLLNKESHYLVIAETKIRPVINEGLKIDQSIERKLHIDNEFFVNEEISYKDKRAFVLDRYFLANNSPLYGTGNDFVEACDRFGAPKNCIVVAAIAKNESDLCKYYGSEEMKNCWGYGGPGIHRWTFPSFKAGIDQVTDILVNRYGIEYMEDPRLMERTFCGDEPACETWGENILLIMSQIERFAASIGVENLE